MKYIVDENGNWLLMQTEIRDQEKMGDLCEQEMKEKDISFGVIWAKDPAGCKFSIRSQTNEVRADEVAEYLAKSVGAGGGQAANAGGFLAECLLLVHHQNADYENYFRENLESYFSRFDIVRSEEYKADLKQMKRYQKKKTKLGVVHTSDFLKEGTPILVRTMEGDMECVSAKDLYIMIGIDGEVYPIRQEKFQNSYEYTEGAPEYKSEKEPVIHNTITGEEYQLIPYIRTCQAKGVYSIFARQLTESTKVFTQWDRYKYLKGDKGDYIAVREDDLSDIYIIEKSVFLRSYERCD
ncbi:hypothetical protein ACTQWG_02185 [Blautia sp. HCP3S3_H10_1]|uniref:hypothetical protein n=1 Tax=unclassified Blautia TaxID=2648079 RepID=UPI003F8F1D32